MKKAFWIGVLLSLAPLSALCATSWVAPQIYYSGTTAPNSAAVNAPRGTLYLSDSMSKAYLKNDDGLSLNWIDISGGGGGGGTWGSITGTLSNQTDLQSALNSKQNTLSLGNLTDTGTDGITITGGTGAVVGSGTSISQHVADATHSGYLATADWNTFNGKQAAGAYITALTGDGAATGPGSAALTLATVNSNVGSFGSSSAVPSFTVNAKGLITAASSTQLSLTAGVSGLLPLGNLASLQVNKVFYVDGARTDSYTADGSEFRPFKTIGAAISQIITNNDNSTHPYTINVTPGAYSETLSFNSTTLTNITINSTTGGVQPTQTTSVSGITSTSNNTQLATLIFNNITVNGNVNLTGDINNTNFCSVQCLFLASQFNNSSGTITLNNVNNVSFYATQIQGSGSVATFTNVAFAYMSNAEGFIGGTTLHLVQNNGANQPSQAGGNYFLMSQSKFYGTATIDAGSEMDSLENYFGSTSSVTNNGIIHSWASAWSGTTNGLVLNNGSTWRNRGDQVWVPPTVNSGATVQNQDYVYMLGGVFGTSAVAATNASVVTKDGHIKTTMTTVPTATVNANAGTGASCTLSNASDTAGTINLTTTATSPASGVQCAVNFNKGYNVAPICSLTPSNANAASIGVSSQVFVSSTTGVLNVNYGVADASGHADTWTYHCIETQ